MIRPHCRHGGADFGATASAVSSLSLDPPMLLVCMSLRGSTQRAIQESRMFGVNILDEDQGQIAERFASLRGERFAGLNVELGGLGVPRLTDALAFCECHVAEDAVDACRSRHFQHLHELTLVGRMGLEPTTGGS